jgi:hypothetical protein
LGDHVAVRASEWMAVSQRVSTSSTAAEGAGGTSAVTLASRTCESLVDRAYR